eukprot:GILJ01005004.1.p1 GENE.GILJ01005004.1~~GILJ01005004.1.p1  ORF type:complete len:330 (-),score=30.32 GILJ01005004.1:452-1441(-)
MSSTFIPIPMDVIMESADPTMMSTITQHVPGTPMRLESHVVLGTWRSDTYQMIKTLRDCIYGKVKLAINLHTQQQVAIKVMDKDRVRRRISQSGTKVLENSLAELGAMRYLSTPGHENVLRLLEASEDDKRIYVVMEFVSQGEMFEVVASQGRFEEVVARHFFRQIVAGVRYLHIKGLTHRDLSLENVLLTEDNNVKIIDFGQCCFIPVSGDGVPQLIEEQGLVGKDYYRAPEVYTGRPYDGASVDVFACGVMLFIMLTGVPPFEQAIPRDPRWRVIGSGQLAQLLQLWKLDRVLSPGVQNLLSRMLDATYQRRIKIEEIIADPWFNGV